MTWRYLAYDILEAYKQTFDDKEISLQNVLFWMMTIANRMMAKSLVKNQNRQIITGTYLNIFPSVPIIDPTEDATNIVAGRKYFTLPDIIFDLENENAIHYITYDLPEENCDPPIFTKVSFSPTTPARSKRLYYNKYEKPTSKNPYFYRVNNFIYLLGVEGIPLNNVEVGLFTAIDPSDTTDLDVNIPLAPEQIQMLRYDVLNLGQYMFLSPADRVNDGADQAGLMSGQKSKSLEPFGGNVSGDMLSTAPPSSKRYNRLENILKGATNE